MSIKLYDNEGKLLKTLFKSSVLEDNLTDLSKDPEVDRFYTENQEMNKYERYRFKKISFPTYSDYFLELTPKDP